MKNEDYVPAKRTGYVYPVLSEKDEFVPDTHIGMYGIFRNPKNKAVYISEQHCQSIRKKTFDGILNFFRRYGSPDFADLFNYNVETFTALGLNYFATQPKIAPLANVIECFTVSPHFNGIRKVAFGIDKRILRSYFKTRSIPIITRTKKKSRDLVLLGAEEVRLSPEVNLKIDRTAWYRRFVNWCELQGVDQQEGIIMAFEQLFNAYPLADLLPTSEYDFLTEFDKPLFVKRKGIAKGTTNKTVELSNVLNGLAEDIIKRYNRDPNNATKQLDFNTYVNNAIYLLNNSMDVKYQDPQLYQEKIQTERMIKYTKENLKKGELKNAQEKSGNRNKPH